MDSETFIVKIKEISSQYKEWWFPPYEAFEEEYSKAHPNYNYTHFRKAFNEFEAELRNQKDVLGEFHEFLDQNYEAYLSASPEQPEEIRMAVSNAYFVDKRGNVNHFLEDLCLRYANEKALPKLKETGDPIWLTRGLTAISLENSGIDSRDTIRALDELHKAAKQKITNPEAEFKRIAQISSTEKPRGGSTPMRELMDR